MSVIGAGVVDLQFQLLLHLNCLRNLRFNSLLKRHENSLVLQRISNLRVVMKNFGASSNVMNKSADDAMSRLRWPSLC